MMRSLPARWFTVLLVTALTGCVSFHPESGWKWKNPLAKKPELKSSQYGEPARMAIIWTPDVMNVPGKPPTRGFGGRLYFYNNLSETIPVDGQLIVYGFDDTDPEKGQVAPERRFGFTPEQFTQHFSSTELGASYSIWIPWDNGQTDYRAVSLVPVFTSVSGQRIVGQPSLNVLPGEKPEFLVRREVMRQRELSMRLPVEQASYVELTPGSREAELAARRIRTTTIEMPKTLVKRLSGSTVVPLEQPAEPDSIARNLEAYSQYQQVQPSEAPAAAGAASRAVAGSRPPNARVTDPLPAHSGYRELPAPARPSDQSARDHAVWQRHHAEQQLGHPFSLQPAGNR